MSLQKAISTAFVSLIVASLAAYFNRGPEGLREMLRPRPEAYPHIHMDFMTMRRFEWGHTVFELSARTGDLVQPHVVALRGNVRVWSQEQDPVTRRQVTARHITLEFAGAAEPQIDLERELEFVDMVGNVQILADGADLSTEHASFRVAEQRLYGALPVRVDRAGHSVRSRGGFEYANLEKKFIFEGGVSGVLGRAPAAGAGGEESPP